MTDPGLVHGAVVAITFGLEWSGDVGDRVAVGVSARYILDQATRERLGE